MYTVNVDQLCIINQSTFETTHGVQVFLPVSKNYFHNNKNINDFTENPYFKQKTIILPNNFLSNLVLLVLFFQNKLYIYTVTHMM